MFLLGSWGGPSDMWQYLNGFKKPWWDASKGWDAGEDPLAKESLTLKSVRELGSCIRESMSMWQYELERVFLGGYQVYL